MYILFWLVSYTGLEVNICIVENITNWKSGIPNDTERHWKGGTPNGLPVQTTIHVHCLDNRTFFLTNIHNFHFCIIMQFHTFLFIFFLFFRFLSFTFYHLKAVSVVQGVESLFVVCHSYKTTNYATETTPFQECVIILIIIYNAIVAIIVNSIFCYVSY